MSDLDRDATAAVLTDAMRHQVSDLQAAPDLPQRVIHQRRRRDHIRTGGVTLGVVAVVGAAAFTFAQSGEAPNATVVPAASASPATRSPTASPPADSAQHPHFDVTALPPGYTYAHRDRQPLPGGVGVIERVDYRRSSGGQITLETVTGDRAIRLADFTESNPDAEEAVINGRTVIHVQNDPQPGGLNIYQWTERPGLNVIIDGRDGATDAELRQFIAGLRVRQ